MTFLETVTHVAGPPVMVGDRIIQRCPVCGEKLADTKEDEDFDGWGEGSLVCIDGTRQVYMGEFLDMKELPEDFCLTLVECG